MKSIFNLSMLVLICIGLSSSMYPAKVKMAKIDISWSFKGIEPGYDHESKIQVYSDGVLLQESISSKQSIPGKMTV